jgi:ribosomal protein L35
MEKLFSDSKKIASGEIKDGRAVQEHLIQRQGTEPKRQGL